MHHLPGADTNQQRLPCVLISVLLYAFMHALNPALAYQAQLKATAACARGPGGFEVAIALHV